MTFDVGVGNLVWESVSDFVSDSVHYAYTPKIRSCVSFYVYRRVHFPVCDSVMSAINVYMSEKL